MKEINALTNQINPKKQKTNKHGNACPNATIEISEFEYLQLLAQGHVAFQSLKASIDLGLYNLLEKHGPLTAIEISSKLELPLNSVKILLRAVLTLQLITKIDDRYDLSHISRTYLTSTCPDDWNAILGWQEKIVYPGLVDFKAALKTGENIGIRQFKGSDHHLYGRLKENEGLLQVFQNSMSALSQVANSDFYNNVDLSNSMSIVDIGGGAGTNLKTLLEIYPEKRGTIFDLPEVCQIANQNIKMWGLEDRLKTHPGNLFESPLPKDADTFIFCHMFTIWSDNTIINILKKCYDALPKGGRVIVFNMMSNDNEIGPMSCALGSPYFLTIATGEGKLHTYSEYKTWFEKSGFSKVTTQKGLTFDHGFIVAIK